MRRSAPNQLSGVVTGTAALTLLFLIALTPGCGQPKAENHADEVKQFLAPTDLNKLTPQAREALRHMPGGDKAQTPGSAPVAPK